MTNLTVRSKLTFAFGGLAFLVLLVAGLAINALSDTQKRFDKFVYGTNARGLTAHLLREAIDARAISARNLVLVTTQQDLTIEKDLVIRAHKDVGIQLSKLKKLAEQPGVTPMTCA